MKLNFEVKHRFDFSGTLKSSARVNILLFYLDVVWFGRWPEPRNFKTSHFRIIYSFPSRISALLMFFLVLKPQCTAKWHVFYIRNRHISVSSFVYKYDQWPHDSYMTGRAGVWEADDIVKFYIALLEFFPATLLSSRYVFSWYPFYFNFHSAHIIFYLWNINNTKADICKIW
jgi:hypothetical protein